MNIRKNRVPLQGLSNFRKTETDFFNNKSKDIWVSIQTDKLKNDKLILAKGRLQKIENEGKIINKTCQIRVQDMNNNALSKIRKAYKNKPNVWRIVKAWKLAKQGFITQSQFQDNLKEILKIDVKSQQSQQIFKQFGIQGKINTQNFLKIIYGQSNSPSFKPRLFDCRQNNPILLEKVDNLIDQLQIYGQNYQKQKQKQKNQSKTHFARILRNENLKINVNTNTNKCQTNQKKQNRQAQKNQKRVKSQCQIKQEFSKEQFYRLTQQSFNKVKLSEKSNIMHPQLMANKDQTKTRFGATANNLPSSSPSQLSSTKYYHFQKINPQNLLNFSSIEKNQKKLKLQAKIQKIREIQKMQKQNIVKLEQKNSEKQNARLLRKKLDRQAYQYASYIKNQWL